MATAKTCAADLRTRMVMQAEVRVPNGTGGSVGQSQWCDIATVWAKLESWKGREVQQAAQQQATQWYKVTIRYRNDVKPSHRFVFMDHGVRHVLNVRDVPVNVDMRSQWLAFNAEEGAAV